MTTAIQFSGGKDSLVCLHLYRDDPDAVVIFADSGSVVPHVREFVESTVAALGMRLHIASPAIPCEEWQDANGLPADILPTNATPFMRPMITEGQSEATLVPYFACCNANIWQPMLRAIKDVGADTVVRGSKACDSRVGAPDGYVDDGVTFLSPIWDWSDDDVFAYLKKVGASLPPQYAMPGADSLDCWCCIAYMDYAGIQRFEYLKEHYPGLYAKAKARLNVVSRTVRAAIANTSFDV